MVAVAGPATRKYKNCLAISITATTLVLIWLYNFAAPEKARMVPIAQSVLHKVRPQSQQTIVNYINLTNLEKYKLSEKFNYRQRTIKTKFFVGDRPDLTVVNETLFDQTHLIDSKNLTDLNVNSLPPLTLEVPSSPKDDPTILSFGCATTIPRLNDSVPQLLHWLANTSCPLHALTPPHDDDLILEREMRAQGINLTITPSTLPFANAYFATIKQLYETRSPNTKWLVLIDDDTFIPSLPTLVEHLTKTYDHTQELMLAAISDDLNQVRNFGLIPFGGGGILISVPLAAHLTKPEIWDKCIENGKEQGDQIVNDCLNDHTSIRPTWDNMLNQMDINGGEGIEAGYFESGRRFLTIHHWKSWFHFPLHLTAQSTLVSGPESILQRFLFIKDNIVLSNGYSISEYPLGIDSDDEGGKWKIDWEKVEMTWEGDDERWIHKFPLRVKFERDRKVGYFLVGSEVLEGSGRGTGMSRGIRQVYVDRAKEEGGIDGVVELVWLF